MYREEIMKKRFTFLFSFILSVVFSTSALAYDVEVDGIYYQIIKGKIAEVTSGEDKYSGDVVIPSSITVQGQEYTVTRIGYHAFYWCNNLTSVDIPNSVTSIGEEAFSWCDSLKSVTIPNSVTSIGNHAFSFCYGLTSVTIPNSVTSIGDCAFTNCSALEDVIVVNNMFVHLPEMYSGHYSIPENISQIIGGAFFNCSGLTSVDIPNSVTSIGKCAFERCSGLTSITIPNSVTSIGDWAFQYCYGLTSVTIPNSVTYIGYYAFAKCSKLENVYCYAEEVPSTHSAAFVESNIASSTLHVPGPALSLYQATAPWSGFGTIKALEGSEPETKKCEKPVISYANGELEFTCSTEGVEFASEIKCDDVKKYNTSKVSLSACYDISVTATKAGYDNSDVATAKLYWLPMSDIGTNINTSKTRGVVIQSAGGFITLSGLDTNERVDFFAIDGAALGSATATDGTATFSTTSGTIVVAKIGKESVKIAVE